MPRTRVAQVLQRILILAGAAALPAGCVTVPAQTPPTRTVEIQQVAAQPVPRESHAASNIDDIFDSCADQMQDIEGAMLAYYRLNHHLPEKLEDLKQVKGLGEGLNFTCPTTHQPYIYVAQGLTAPGDDRLMVLYDGQPHRDGKRRAILMRLPVGTQISTADAKVLNLPESVIRSYVNPLLPPAAR